MPADASIYSMLRPQQQQPGPMDQFGQVLQMKHLMGQQGLQDLQRKQIESGMADDARVKELFAQGNVTPEQLMAADPKTGMAYSKVLLENKRTQGGIDKDRAETLLKQASYMRDKLATVQDQAGYSAWIEEGARIFGPDAARSNPPQFSPEVKNALLTKADDLIVPLSKKLDLESARRGQDITMRGQDLTRDTSIRGQDLTASTAIRGQDLVDARTREAAAGDKFGEPKEVTGPSGTPLLVMQNKRTGELVDANTKQPIAGVGPKVGESAQKQQTGVQNTVAAITEYRDMLKNWSATDILKPDARAKMGTSYNNMLLQAKEAFNLGVLNGPDYQILQEVITSPASLKGGITSKEALDAQAAKLEEIMGNISQTVTNVQSGIQTGAPKAQAKTFDSMPDPVSFNGKRIKADDGTIYKSDGKRWTRQ